MIKYNFATIIMSHGRPNNVVTYKTLRRQGYTGKIYILIDNEDKLADEYYSNFGNEVIMFNKTEYASKIKTFDNIDDNRSTVFARNYSFILAKSLNIDYFWLLDDDYTIFRYRYDKNWNFITYNKIKNLDDVINTVLDYFSKLPIDAIAFAQGGDFIGGVNNNMAQLKHFKRKLMNTMIHKTNNVIEYVARYNDDITTSVYWGNKGKIFLTIPSVFIGQAPTQQLKGGITEAYKNFGTYVKSFYTILALPSCATIEAMGYKYDRIHHKINWNKAVPKIISSHYKIHA